MAQPLDGEASTIFNTAADTCPVGQISLKKKRNRHFYGKTQLTLKQRSDLALGKHLSVGACILSTGRTQLPKHGPLPEMQSCVVLKHDPGRLWVIHRSCIVPASPTGCLPLDTYV